MGRGAGLALHPLRDDLTFSRPEGGDPPSVKALLAFLRMVTESEGFQIHHKKTYVMRRGSQQKVTGLIVNGEGTPRNPRLLKRRLRAMIHNLSRGGALHEGESLNQLAGYISFVHMAEPARGRIPSSRSARQWDWVN